MSDPVKASIESYETGDCTRLAVYMDFLYLIPRMGVQQLVDLIPADWRPGFIDWLVQNYDSDVPAEEYIAIGLSEEEANMRPDPILLVREWLQSRK